MAVGGVLGGGRGGACPHRDGPETLLVAQREAPGAVAAHGEAVEHDLARIEGDVGRQVVHGLEHGGLCGPDVPVGQPAGLGREDHPASFAVVADGAGEGAALVDAAAVQDHEEGAGLGRVVVARHVGGVGQSGPVERRAVNIAEGPPARLEGGGPLP